MKKSKERIRLMWRVSLLVLLANICIASYSGNRLYAGGVSGSLEQMILDKKVSLNFKNKPIKDVLEEIKKQTGVGFAISAEIENAIGRVSVNANDLSLSEALEQVFAGTNYEGKSVNDQIVVVKKSAQKGKVTISGSVLDNYKIPVPGAIVFIKGTKIGVEADLDGKFKLEMDKAGAIEVVAMGYKTYTRDILRSENDMKIVLEVDNVLEEVVVTGIFKKSRESFTGAVSVVNEEALKMVGNKNLLQSVGNIDPSFNMLANNEFGSDPNHLPDISIRGSANLPTLENLQDGTNTDLNTPLIIMDGFEIDLQRMMDLNSDEVESITILKDGTATAIYGSRGANGVVVITSKEPEAGKLKITYNGSLNVETPDLSDYNLLNARDKLALEKQMGYYESTNLNRDILLKNKYAQRLADVERGVNTDWLSKPLRVGVGQRHGVRLEGGDKTFRYSASVQYNNVKGVMKKSDRSSLNAGVNLSYYHKNILFRNDLQISYTDSKNSPYGSFSDYTSLNPYWKPYDDNGKMIKLFDDDIEFYDGFSKLPKNPLYNATLNMKSGNKYTQITNNFSIEWKPFEGFIARGRFTINSKNTEYDNYKPATHTDFEADEYKTSDGIFRKGSYDYRTGKSFDYEAAVTLSYSKIFGDRHWFYAGLNADIESRSSREYGFSVEGFLEESLDFLGSALQYELGGVPNGYESTTRRVGLVGNLNYSYDNRYYVDFAYRVDGSSQFGTDKRFAPFYSVGAGWNIEREKFMENVDFIDRLKIRASFGQTGSQKFNAYQAKATYNFYLNDRYFQWIGAYQKALENPDLEWQKTDKFNAGIEIELFENRFNVMFDVYKEKTSNLLSSMELPLSNGFTSYIANVGKKEDNGFELKATAVLVRNLDKRIVWSVTGTMAHNQDRIIKLSPALIAMYDKLIAEGGTLPNNILREGESQNTIYAVHSLGIDPSTGRELFLKKNGEVSYTWDANDRVACGLSLPKYRGNLSTMFRWQDLSVNVSFAYRLGGQLYNSTLVSKVEGADMRFNVDERVYNDRWQNPGDRTAFKSLYDESTTYPTSRFVQDESTISLQNIYLSYTFQNNRWLKNTLGIQNLTLGANVSDLFYISTVKQERGLSYPYSRRFSFSLGIQF